MSLSSHAGQDTFTIAGKTVNKRAGTSNIYDITGGPGGGLTPTWYGHWFARLDRAGQGFILRDTDDNPATATDRQGASAWYEGGMPSGNVGNKFYDNKSHETSSGYVASTDQSWRLLSGQAASSTPCLYTATETRQVTFHCDSRCEVVLNDRRVFVTDHVLGTHTMWVKSGDVYYVRPQLHVNNPYYSWHETHFA